MANQEITIKGAREHNLRNVSLTLPRGELICFTGVSGSGKSSLAFDTLYAEGQRRYVESLSNYARQFMGQMPKPDVDLITGLSPSISISQKSTGNNPRSTVGTITEIYDFFRILYARVGTGFCADCGSEIASQTRQQILGRVQQLDPTCNLLVLAPLLRAQKGEFRDLFEDLRKQGFVRCRIDGDLYRIDSPPALDRNRKHDVDVVVDRLPADSRSRGRLAEAIDVALQVGNGTMLVILEPASPTIGFEGNLEDEGEPVASHSSSAQEILFSSEYACKQCGRSYPPPTPQLFSFNSPQGMCSGCDGLGKLYTFVPEKLIPDPALSFKKGALELVGKWANIAKYKRNIYQGVADTVESTWKLPAGTMLNTPWKALPLEAQQAWLWGTGDLHITFTWRGGSRPTKYGGTFSGIIAELVDKYRSTKNRMFLRAMEKYMDTLDCPDCHGLRLNPQARSVRIHSGHPTFRDQGSLSLPEICALPVQQVADFISDLRLSDSAQFIAHEVLKELRARIGFLLGVGLDYLSLSRTAPTLSGGESQRIRLAGQIGSGLAGVLYVLDEPSIGLHPRDNQRLIETLITLRDRGNTLVVVEHDEDTMRAADKIVDFGPGPGVRGGRVVAQGSVEDIVSSAKSITGAFLSGKETIAVPTNTRRGHEKHLTIRGATHNNLKGLDAQFPLGCFVCVTGVSGSGKSSLIGDILEPALRAALNGAECIPGNHRAIEGLEFLDKTISIDQSPIGRTPRSNPATYVKVFDEIRSLYAQLPEAKARGYSIGRFSFNVDGGRCSACDGNGSNKLEMDFLADVWVTCPACEGKRYNRETLTVQFKGHSIADVLQLDVAEAYKLFKNIPKIASSLKTLIDVGLEYLKLGQPSPTLSGGEAQRIKLSRELAKKSTGKTLYILDEPTTGLHFADVRMLLKVLHDLVDMGNTVVVVEHNLDVIKTADWIIDLGPEGGDAGGSIVTEGPPTTVAQCPNSYTGKALREILDTQHSPISKPHKAPQPAQRSKHDSAPYQDASSEVESVKRQLVINGASQHNLKHVDVSIPRDAMTVFCGPSGSGKSSLAMDTIYAEGQRRYVESLSAYARQFIGQMQKPQVERIEGLSPAVALEQKNLGHSPRSTVGTVTEIYDYLRVLMARMGSMFCPECHVQVKTQSIDQIVDRVMKMPEGTKFLLLAPLNDHSSPHSQTLWQSLRQQGFSRARIDGATMLLEDIPDLDDKQQHDIQLVIDRLVLRSDDRTRLAQSVELGLELGQGVIQIAIVQDQRDERDWEIVSHNRNLACECCGRSFQAVTPHHFSFNTPLGSCPQCDGLGVQTGTNPRALLRDGRMTLAQGGLAFWPNLSSQIGQAMLVALCRQTGMPLDCPIDEFSSVHRRTLFHGSGEQWIEVTRRDYDEAQRTFDKRAETTTSSTPAFRFQFKGLYPTLEEASRLNYRFRIQLQQFVDRIPCTACDGARLNEVSCAVQFRESTLGDLVRQPLGRLLKTVKDWSFTAAERRVAGELIREIRQRIQFLVDVGLEYLTLGREAASLSGGEGQRIRLAAQLGSGLCGVLYVLDEPTTGLHPRDNQRLINALHRLRDLGNTLLVVEHDFDVIQSSDYLCDFGPLAGNNGGEIVAQGPPTNLVTQGPSLTAPYLEGTKSIPIPANRRMQDSEQHSQWLTIHGAAENNLRGIDARIPLGVFTAITGPSGSGKSTLINEIVYPILGRQFSHQLSVRPGKHRGFEIPPKCIDKVIRVDQSPLGNTPASTPATYTGLFDLIRTLMAKLPEAKQRGYTARQFSFNVPGGRCEACEGSGQVRIEMHFLPDVWIQCESCQGRRYTEETLNVRFHGYSIADILNLSCRDAMRVFGAHPKIKRILQTLCDVGLDYVTLGQSAPTLSGGEAQRVKLATELARPDTGKTLYLLDEPTTGLHFDDIAKLLDVLQRLVDLGNTVVVIEHNLDVIKSADWVIDLGPEAGVEGGLIVCEGTPEQIASYAARQKQRKTSQQTPEPAQYRSYTGEALKLVLDRGITVVRKTITREDYLRKQLEESKQKAPRINEQDEIRPAWEVDGKRWHLTEFKSRSGEPIAWDSRCLPLLMQWIEDVSLFPKINYRHDSIIHVSGIQTHEPSEFSRTDWFMHIFTREQNWLKVKVRVPRGSFQEADLVAAFPFPVLSAMNIPGMYSRHKRFICRVTRIFIELEFRFFSLSELDTEEFRLFLRQAIAAYGGIEIDEVPLLQPSLAGNASQSSADAEDANKSGLSHNSTVDNSGSIAATSIEPWKVIGRRWHSLPKGFIDGKTPTWSLAMVETTLNWLSRISGKDSLIFDAPERVTLQPQQSQHCWATVETKHPDMLRITLTGPKSSVDKRLLNKVKKICTAVLGNKDGGKVIIELTEPSQLENPSLLSLVDQHYQRTITAR